MVIAVWSHEIEDRFCRELAAGHNKTAFIGTAAKLDGIAAAGRRRHFGKSDAILRFDPPVSPLVCV